MIEKFTFENEDQIYQCERQVKGKGELRQTIHVTGIGSKNDSILYGVSKHSAASMTVAARRIALEIIQGNKRSSKDKT